MNDSNFFFRFVFLSVSSNFTLHQQWLFLVSWGKEALQSVIFWVKKKLPGLKLMNRATKIKSWFWSQVRFFLILTCFENCHLLRHFLKTISIIPLFYVRLRKENCHLTCWIRLSHLVSKYFLLKGFFFLLIFL